MPEPRVLILHGFQHHRSADHPNLAARIQLATSELAMLGDGKRIVVTHSLGCVLWSHLVRRGLRSGEWPGHAAAQ